MLQHREVGLFRQLRFGKRPGAIEVALLESGQRSVNVLILLHRLRAYRRAQLTVNSDRNSALLFRCDAHVLTVEVFRRGLGVLTSLGALVPALAVAGRFGPAFLSQSDCSFHSNRMPRLRPVLTTPT